MAKGKYKEWLEPDSLLQLKAWARDGLTDKEIAQNMGINYTTLYEWFNKYPEIHEAIKKGRKPVIVEVEDTFFEKKLKGYTVTEKTKEVTTHPDGSQTKHVKETERYIPPDTTAMIFFLKNRAPERYRDKPVDDNSNNEVIEKLDSVLDEIKGIE